MQKGDRKATQVCIFDNSNGTFFDDSMLPADDDSLRARWREVLLGAIDNFFPGDTHVYEYVFTVDFGNPANSTLAGVDGSMPISVPAFIWRSAPPVPQHRLRPAAEHRIRSTGHARRSTDVPAGALQRARHSNTFW